MVDDKERFCRAILRVSYFQEPPDKFTIVHTARNGIDDLEYLWTALADGTLTDTHMPLMNGIELLKAIQKEHLCRRSILIRAYAEFAYPKKDT